MNKKIETLINTIFPSKKINTFVYLTFLIGILSGAIFLILLSQTDKTLISDQITLFIQNIATNTINSRQAFQNSLITNYIYIFLLFFLGISIIGIFGNIFLIYIKGFFIGFTIASYIGIYKIKGILIPLISLISYQLISIFSVLAIGIYSIIISHHFFKQIKQKRTSNSNNKMFKKYIIIFIISLLLSTISSLLEAFFFPKILKLIINIYI